MKIFLSLNFYRENFSRVFTIAEKNIKLQLRFKFSLISSFLIPIISIIMPIIILSKFLVTGNQFGPWNETNYYIFILISYNIGLLQRIISDFPTDFREEKYWKTLPALLIAPINKLHLLLGIFFSHLFLISIPFAIFFIIAYIYYPISFLTIIFVILIYLLIDFIFSGIGLFTAVFAISKENIWTVIQVVLLVVFWASCISYPFEIFPNFLQKIIQLNPFYYFFDVLRVSWIDNNILVTLSDYPFHFLLLIAAAFIVPIISIYVFNNVYKKFGIVGY